MPGRRLPPAAWAAVATGGLLRLLLLVLTKLDQPLLLNDSFYYSAQATRLAEGKWFVDLANQPAAEHGPLTPLMLSLVSWGDDPVNWQRLVNVLVGTATIVGVGLLAQRLHSPRAAIVAAWIAALYPNLWINDTLVMSEPLACLIIVVTLVLVDRLGPTAGTRSYLAIGVCVGLGALTRSELVLLGPLIGLAVLRHWRRSLVVIGTSLCVIAPWSLFNLQRFERPVLLTTNEGTTLLAANCPATYYGDHIGSGSLPCVLAFDGSSIPDHSERSAAQRHAALVYATDHATRWPIVVAARVARTADLYAVRQMVHDDDAEERGRRSAWLGVAAWWALAPLGLIGLCRLPATRRRLLLMPIACVAFVTVTVYGSHRVRAPMEPIVAVAAALALTGALDRRTITERLFAARNRFVRSAPARASAIVGAVCAAYAAALCARGWRAAWDTAFIGGRAFDVLGPRPPLLGMPSTASEVTGVVTHHPGPWHFLLVAVPHQLLSWTPFALVLAEALLVAAALIIVVYAAHTLRPDRGRGARWGAVGAVALMASAGTAVVTDPWNPHAAMFVFAAAVASTAASAADPCRWIYPAIATASLTAQAHLSFALPAAALLCTTGWLAFRRRDQLTRRRRWIIAGTATLMWLPTLAAELRGGSSNIAALIRGSTGSDTIGWRPAFDRAIHAVQPGGFLFRRTVSAERLTSHPSLLTVVISGLILALSAVGAVRVTQRRPELRPAVIGVAAAAAATLVATARYPTTYAGLFGVQLARVWWPIAILVWALALSVIATFLRFPRAAVSPLVTVAVVASTVLGVAFPDRDAIRDEAWFSSIDAVSDAVVQHLGSHAARVVVTSDDVAAESAIIAGVWYDLRRRGFDAVIVGPVSPGLVGSGHWLPRAPTDAAIVSIGIDGGHPLAGSPVYNGELAPRTGARQIDVSVQLPGG